MKRKILVLICLLLGVLNTYSQITNCAACDERLLTAKDLDGKSMEEIALLRNEIFAHKGYVFDNHIQDNTITISTGEYSHSAIFGDFDDGYSDYMSEGEWAAHWIFTMEEDGIKFDSYQIAG